MQFIDLLLRDERLDGEKKLSAPSVSHDDKRLYVRGVFEQSTRPNLEKVMGDLVEESNEVLQVNDKKLPYTLKVRLIYE